MAGFSRVVISDLLVIKALNTPGGSGGVWRWIEAVKRDTIKNAIRIAPTNDPLNAIHRGGVVGTYRASFRSDGRGSNGHFLRRSIYNTADHARIVEHGRRSTRGGRWEVFYWSQHPGREIRTRGTSGRHGDHVLERAFFMAMAKKRRAFISGRIT